MMTACRYACAVLVFIFVSLTPTSCSDVSEPAVAAEEANATVISETVRTGEDAVVRDPVDDGEQEIGS